MAVITPDTSGARSAPRTARSVPTAWNSPCHSVNCALAVETVCGGTPCAAMLSRILPPNQYLKPNSPPNNIPTAPSMMSMRLIMTSDSLNSPRDGSVGERHRRSARLLLRAIPPTAAQRLKQRRRVRVARGLRLHQGKFRERILPLGVEQLHIVRRAELELLLRHLEALARGGFGLGLR